MDLVARARLASGAGTLSGPGLTAVATGQLDSHFRPQFMLCELHAIAAPLPRDIRGNNLPVGLMLEIRSACRR